MSEDKKTGVVKNKIEKPTAVVVASIVDYPVTIKYGKESVRITGRSRLTFEDHSLLQQPLPAGLVSKKL